MRKLAEARHSTSGVAVLLCAALATGCAPSIEETGAPPKNKAREPAVAIATPQEATTAPGPLADTAWRLVQFQSMDDAVGTVRPENPAAFTMRLNADGKVNMKLDCNRASGTWSSEPAGDGASGSFTFGPLAMTRAICPPPNLDEQIGRHAEHVRSYLLKDGRLHLSLMADGGIYTWEPLPEGVRFVVEPDPELEPAILAASPDYTRESVETLGRKARYVWAAVDLNGDGKDEVLVYTLGSVFCGTGGCNLLLFSRGTNGYVLVNNFPISRLPVIVSPEMTNGWHDLVRPESGGGAAPSYVRHTFDGKKYVVQERVPGDAAPEGTPCLTGDLSFDSGAPLEPRG